MHPTDFTLNEYLDNELGPSEHDAVRTHVIGCTVCRALLAQLDDVKRSAATLGPIDPPSRVRTRLDDRIGSAGPEPLGAWSSTGSFGPLAAAAALLIGTLVGVRFGPLPGSSPSPAFSSSRSVDPLSPG